MPTPDSHEPFEPPRERLPQPDELSRTSRAITRRAMQDVYFARQHMEELDPFNALFREIEGYYQEGETELDQYVQRLTAQTAELFLPNRYDINGKVDTNINYFGFNEVRLALLPSPQVLAADFEDEGPIALLKGQSLHTGMRRTLERGGLIRPVLPSVSAQIRMWDEAKEMVSEQSNGNLAPETLDRSIALVYMRGASFDELQRRHYRTPQRYADAGIATLDEITGVTMAKLEFYSQYDRKPTRDDLLGIYDFQKHDPAAEKLKVYRGRVLGKRLDQLWPKWQGEVNPATKAKLTIPL